MMRPVPSWRRECGPRILIAAMAAVCGLLAGIGCASAAGKGVGRKGGGQFPRILSEVLSPPRGNTERRRRYLQLLLRAGAERAAVEVAPIRGRGSRESNVFIRRRGSAPASGTIVIAAHTDSTGKGQGAVDDWSGAVMLAALFAGFRDLSPRHDLLFAAFSGEEQGGNGSRQFVDSLRPAQRERIKAMINLECLGVGEVRIWVNRSADALERLCREAGRQVRVPVGRQVLFGLRSDADAFIRAGIPAIVLHSLSPARLACINCARDRIDLIDLEHYRQAYRLLAAFIRLVDAVRGKVRGADAERSLRPVPSTLVDACGDVAGNDGVRVCKQLPGRSAAARAGIRRGDIITHVAGNAVRDLRELRAVFWTLRRGGKVVVRLRRGAGDKERRAIRAELAY